MSINRITGIASGMDTETMIKNLMKLEQMKIDNVEKDRQVAEWQQAAYREIIDTVKAFKDEYFDLLKPSTNFLSRSSFSEFSESVTLNGAAVDYLTMTGTPAIGSFSHSISSIDQLATKDTWTTDRLGIADLSSGTLDFGLKPGSLEFSIVIDGSAKTISIEDTSSIADNVDLVAALDAKIQEAFGSDYAGVVKTDGPDGIAFRLDGGKVSVLETTGHEMDLTWLGYTSGDSTESYKSESLQSLFGIADADLSDMIVNGIALDTLGLTAGSTLADLTTALSSSEDMAVSLAYNAVSDSFELTSDNTGSANAIVMNQTFMDKLGFVDDANHHADAANAILTIDGSTIIKSDNTFLLDGIQYDLKKTYDGSSGDISLSVETDTSAIVDKIKTFVETYNGMISMIQGKLEEKRSYDYEPLTKEEKEAMSDDDIEKWEEKAKQGLLRSDSTLSSMLTNMRMALYESVEGVGLTLADIGIQTSSNYKDGGKLIINEAELTSALENDFEKVISLFTNESDKEYGDSANISERYRENGLAQRLHDLIENSIRTTRDTDGRKGILLEKAGIKGDGTEFNNLISEQIRAFQSRIDNLWDAYYSKEESYYRMFGRMESALAQMQSQSDSLFSQMG